MTNMLTVEAVRQAIAGSYAHGPFWLSMGKSMGTADVILPLAITALCGLLAILLVLAPPGTSTKVRPFALVSAVIFVGLFTSVIRTTYFASLSPALAADAAVIFKGEDALFGQKRTDGGDRNIADVVEARYAVERALADAEAIQRKLAFIQGKEQSTSSGGIGAAALLLSLR